MTNLTMHQLNKGVYPESPQSRTLTKIAYISGCSGQWGFRHKGTEYHQTSVHADQITSSYSLSYVCVHQWFA